MIKDGIESNNFSLIYDSCIMSKGYLDVIAGYARKAFEDMYVVSENAVYEPPEQDKTAEDTDADVEDVDAEVIEDTEDTENTENATENEEIQEEEASENTESTDV